MLDRLIFASLQGLIALVGVGAICFVFRRLPASFKVWLWRLAMLKMAVALCFPAPTLRILPGSVVQREVLNSPARVVPAPDTKGTSHPLATTTVSLPKPVRLDSWTAPIVGGTGSRHIELGT